jgi:predicted dehydrogenase
MERIIDKPAKVGVIGAGEVANSYHLPVLAAMREVELKWVCDLDRTRAARLARAFGIAQVEQDLGDCADVDIALVAIPVGHRRSILETIFSRKWNAFIEKPFAVSRAEHQEILRRAEEACVQVGAAFLRRFYAGTAIAEQIVAQSLLGPILQIWATEGVQIRSTGRNEAQSWRSSRLAAGGGLLIETSCHMVDQVLIISGARQFTLEHCEITYCDDVDFEFKSAGILELRDGARCRFGIGGSWLQELYNAIVIEFERARLKVSLNADDAGAWLVDAQGNPIAHLSGIARSAMANKGGPQAVYAEWSEFLRQCDTRQPSRVCAESALLTTSFVEDCYKQQLPSQTKSSDSQI